MFDVIKTPPEEVHKDLAKLVHPGIQLLVVANKMDLNPYTKVEQYLEQRTGAEQGAGSREQGQRAGSRELTTFPDPPFPRTSTLQPFNPSTH